jgi:NTE family protein
MEYQRSAVNWLQYYPVTPKLSFQSQIFSGITYQDPTNPLNAFIVGGLTENFRNQVQFVGLREFELFTNNIQMLQLGVRYELMKDFYAVFRSNAASYADHTNEVFYNVVHAKNAGVGYGITGAYNSLFGPLEITAMYYSHMRDLRLYLNLGFNF